MVYLRIELLSRAAGIRRAIEFVPGAFQGACPGNKGGLSAANLLIGHSAGGHKHRLTPSRSRITLNLKGNEMELRSKSRFLKKERENE
jgi:hypothetical protein